MPIGHQNQNSSDFFASNSTAIAASKQIAWSPLSHANPYRGELGPIAICRRVPKTYERALRVRTEDKEIKN
jgi:hypothetical protein